MLSFSALQRAEIAEIGHVGYQHRKRAGFSALQRAEIAEINPANFTLDSPRGFSALQRAEIAEIADRISLHTPANPVSVLFNEPKLLKLYGFG